MLWTLARSYFKVYGKLLKSLYIKTYLLVLFFAALRVCGIFSNTIENICLHMILFLNVQIARKKLPLCVLHSVYSTMEYVSTRDNQTAMDINTIPGHLSPAKKLKQERLQRDKECPNPT